MQNQFPADMQQVSPALWLDTRGKPKNDAGR
jgi:hypothetical protein